MPAVPCIQSAAIYPAQTCRSMDSATADTRSGDRTPSVECQEFLIAFARAVQKHSMYPPEHPAVKPVATALLEALSPLVDDRRSLRLRVARDRFIIDDAATDPDHPLIGGLARRLHHHQLLGLTFLEDVDEEELTDFLSTVAVEPSRESEPLGASGPEELERWRHVMLEPVPYESLSLSREGDSRGDKGPEGAQEFWARVGSWVGTGVDAAGGEAPSGESGAGAPYDRLIENYLPQLTHALASSEIDDSALREGMSRLILSLKPDQLRKLLQMARTSGEEELPVAETPEELTRQAIDELLAAAEDSTGQDVPIWLVRLLTKIGMYAENAADAPGSEADGSLTQIVAQLAGGWDVEDAKPEDYENALGLLVNRTPVLEAGRRWVEEPRPQRIVQMGLECDSTDETFSRGVEAIAEHGEALPGLLEMLDAAPSESRSAELAWDVLSTPDRVRMLLSVETPDFALLDRLLPRVGLEAVDPMLDVLVEAESTSVRRELFNRLIQLGPEIGPRIVKRLSDERWFVRRNMLAILDRLPSWPASFRPTPYISDPEPRVRHEAVKLALKVPEERDLAIRAALNEADLRTVALGLTAAEESCPSDAIPLIIEHLRSGDLPVGLRVRGIRGLGSTRSPEARQILLKLTWARRWFFFGRLAPRSPEMLEALSVLGVVWKHDPEAKRVLRAAKKSSDARVRAAAQGSKGGR